MVLGIDAQFSSHDIAVDADADSILGSLVGVIPRHVRLRHIAAISAAVLNMGLHDSAAFNVGPHHFTPQDDSSSSSGSDPFSESSFTSTLASSSGSLGQAQVAAHPGNIAPATNASHGAGAVVNLSFAIQQMLQESLLDMPWTGLHITED
ncbi:hypothetical protein SCUCBS95973_003436 [Sporothrix curviconia]|uniref:Uncharacterized protein n=1 Tax=Sporothrix curviconia TaxID=1260050 RepID=A0ABP0BFM5_9PEZI